jgi:peptidoglycan-associated lipoprotein
MKSAAALTLIVLTVAACGSTEVKQAQAPSGSTAPKPTAPASPASRTSPSGSAPVAGNPLTDPKNILSQRSVYFEFDDSAVRSQDQALLQAHGKYLATNRGVRAKIEGNCDERGSREYNLALGQRRAQSAKNVLKVLGVDDSRVEVVSFGEDKPAAAGHDEASWAKNRRADIRYPGE